MRIATLGLACLLAWSPCRAAEPAAAPTRAAACAACHGADGISQTAETPSLAGQPEGFLQWQMVFFRSGTRKSAVMQPLAAGLKDDDIRELSAYYAALPPPVRAGGAVADAALFEAGRELAAQHRCASCHGQTYAGAQAAARTAHQREDYLLKALRDFKSGQRTGGGVAAMADAVYPLGDKELRAVAHYMAQFH